VLGKPITLVGAAFLAVAMPAGGATPYISITISDVQGCALYHGPCNALPTLTETSTTVPLLAPPTQNVSAPSGYGTTASSSFTGSVTYRKVTWSGSVSASEPTTVGLPVGTPNYEAYGSAQMSATVVDTLTVAAITQPNGTLLPNGSPVEVLITITNTGSYECAGGYTPNEEGEVAVQVQFANSNYPWTQLNQRCGTLSLNAQQQFMYSATVGQSIPMQFSLETSLNAYSANEDTGSASFDPPGGGLNIDSMTPGAVLVSQSGTDYSSAATTGDTDGPMPLWALGALGAGLLGIASRKLKKAN
jgi:hypothetical protein